MTKPMVIIEPAGMKNQDGGEIWHIRLGFETVSWQHAAHIQKGSYSIHAEPFSRTPKSSKQKKGSASRVLSPLFDDFLISFVLFENRKMLSTFLSLFLF